MNSKKPNIMKISKKYNYHYWDGDRDYGYGGYVDDGRWAKIAKRLIKKYKLNKNSKILDIGCGKGFLVNELKKALNSNNVFGLDISKYAIRKSPQNIRRNLKIFDARKKINYKKNHFDLIICINLIHNFEINVIERFLKNITQISKKTYLSTESYRNENELFNLQCWALTCESFFSDKEWKWIFETNGYFRDYELIYFS